MLADLPGGPWAPPCLEPWTCLVSSRPLASLSPAPPSVHGDDVGLGQCLTQQQSCSWAHVSRMKTSSRMSPGGPWCPHSLPALRRMPAQGGTAWTRTDGRDAAGRAHDGALSKPHDTLRREHDSGQNHSPSAPRPGTSARGALPRMTRAHGLLGVLGDCPRTVYNSCRLEAPCRPTAGLAHSPGLSCPREHGAASKRKDLPRRLQKGPPTRCKEASSASGAGEEQCCIPSVFNMGEADPLS